MKNDIQVTQSSIPLYEEYIEEIKDLWDTRWLTNNGSKHQKLEGNLKDYLQTSNITLFTNGHLALEYIIEALQLSGEVITTPYTFASTTHAIVRNGLTPVFCDINKDDFTIQSSQIESLITERTSAIIAVHVYGNICDIEAIERIAEKYNLKVIYDAAHAFGITVNGEGVANFGDASMFSFHATKIFNSIEGGAVTYKNPLLKRILEAYKNFGLTGPETVEYIGGNAKMNEFQAAMGLCNLRNIDQEINNRKKVFERYIDQLNGLKGIQLPKIQSGVESNYAYFPIVIEGSPKKRNIIYEELQKQNIFARKYFYPLTNMLDCYKDCFDSKLTPVAKYISDRVLTLPLYPHLTNKNIDRITTIIKSDISIL